MLIPISSGVSRSHQAVLRRRQFAMSLCLRLGNHKYGFVVTGHGTAMTTAGYPDVGSALGLVMFTSNRSGHRAPRGGNFGRVAGRVARDALVIMIAITIAKIHIDEVTVHRGTGRKGNAESVCDWIGDARSLLGRFRGKTDLVE